MEPVGYTSPLSPFRGLMDQMERRERHLALSRHILESLGILFPPDTIEGGHVLRSRSINDQFSGREDLALARCRHLIGLGRRLRNDDLLRRAWSGIRGVSQARGNLPATERALRRERKYTERLGDPRLMFVVLGSEAYVHGQRGNYQASMEACWGAYQVADDVLKRAYVIANIAETLYRAGQFEAARAARAIALGFPTEIGAQIINLGGYAMTCAAVKDLAGVRWAGEQALRLTDDGRKTRGIAQGLLGCAEACGKVGLDKLASTLFERGLAIANTHGYHDLRFIPDPTHREGPPPVQPFSGIAEEARKSILELAPTGVPTTPVLVAD